MEEKFVAAWLANRAKASQIGVRLRPIEADEAIKTAHRWLSGLFASGNVLDRLVLVFVPMVIGMAVYFTLTYLLKCQPIREFLAPILKRGAQK